MNPDIFLIEENQRQIKITYLGSDEKNFIINLESPEGTIKSKINSTFNCPFHWRLFDFNCKESDRLVICDEFGSPFKIYNLSENFVKLNQTKKNQGDVKVSVIVPCYNFGNYIEHSIYSVLSQKTDFEFEILVGDDFSIDSTKSILDRLSYYNKNIRYFRYNKNIGGKNNVKFLLDNSLGEYIAYLDGDDFWTDNLKLQKQVNFLDNNPEYSMCFTGHWSYGNDGMSYPDKGWIGHVNNGGEVNEDYLLNSNPVSSLTKVFRNYKNENWDPYLNVIPFFDWGHNLLLSKKGKIKYMDFPSGVYRNHIGGIFSNMKESEREKKREETKKILLKIGSSKI